MSSNSPFQKKIINRNRLEGISSMISNKPNQAVPDGTDSGRNSIERSEVQMNQSFYSNNSQMPKNFAVKSHMSSGNHSLFNNSNFATARQNDSFVNKRTIDRAAIMEEIQQNKIDEIRSNLSINKNFNRKFSKFSTSSGDQSSKKVMVSQIINSQGVPSIMLKEIN